jgi:hypothetical protein
VGPALAGTARRLAGDEASDAEATIQRAFGLGRRLYERWFTLPDGVYVEVTPDPPGQATMPPSTGMTAPVR